MEFPVQPFTDVYVIYSADVLAASERFIGQMAPAHHMTAGYTGEKQAEHARIAALFTQTEGNEQYDFGYLGNEYRPPRVRYFPYGCTDAEGTAPGDGYEGETGKGQHRKWVAELTREEWLAFAATYIIDLDEAGYPEHYEETLGSITEHGRLEALSVDNREGWNDSSGGEVIDSYMYVSFAYASDPNADESP